jgi:uncharacterized membrane protein
MTTPKPLLLPSEPLQNNPIQNNIEAIIGLQSRHEQTTPSHQRILEKMAAGFGEPRFLYFQFMFFVVWGMLSYLYPMALTAWNISTAVLVFQTRDSKLSEERSLLMLQMDLLTEQKLAKLIALIEELRTDLPNVHNREDLEAQLMKQATDPQEVLDILHEALNQAIDPDLQGEKFQPPNAKIDYPKI